MLHMSNSAYATALDEARAIWQIQMVGTTMRADHEQVRPMIASTHYTFFAEIPVRKLSPICPSAKLLL